MFFRGHLTGHRGSAPWQRPHRGQAAECTGWGFGRAPLHTRPWERDWLWLSHLSKVEGPSQVWVRPGGAGFNRKPKQRFWHHSPSRSVCCAEKAEESCPWQRLWVPAWCLFSLLPHWHNLNYIQASVYPVQRLHFPDPLSTGLANEKKAKVIGQGLWEIDL